MKKEFLILMIVMLPVILFSQTIKKTPIQITIKEAWLRPAAINANSALFCEVTNTSNLPDTLISAKGKISEIVEIHETYKKENDMMSMREVHNVVITANGSVKLKPQSLHVMLIGILKDVRLGENHEFTLVFKKAGEIKVKAVVRDMPMMK